MSSGVPFQVEGVVETLAAEGAQVSLRVAVTLHVPVEKSLEVEDFRAHATLKLGRIRLGPCRRQFSASRLFSGFG